MKELAKREFKRDQEMNRKLTFHKISISLFWAQIQLIYYGIPPDVKRLEGGSWLRNLVEYLREVSKMKSKSSQPMPWPIFQKFLTF